MKDRRRGEDEPGDTSRAERVRRFRQPVSRPGPEGRDSSAGGRSGPGGSRSRSYPPRGSGGGAGEFDEELEETEDEEDLERLSREAQQAVKLRRDKAQKVENTRRRFFIATALWGFLAGWIAIPLGMFTVGRHVQWWRWRSMATTLIFLLLCYLGARLINKLYRDVRLRGR